MFLIICEFDMAIYCSCVSFFPILLIVNSVIKEAEWNVILFLGTGRNVLMLSMDCSRGSCLDRVFLYLMSPGYLSC